MLGLMRKLPTPPGAMTTRHAMTPELERAVEQLREHVLIQNELRTAEHDLNAANIHNERRLDALPGLERKVHDESYHAYVKSERDPSFTYDKAAYDARLDALRREREDLTHRVNAVANELAKIRARREHLNTNIPAYRKQVWAVIAKSLIDEFPPEFVARFYELWVALERSVDGIYAIGVLDRLLDTRSGIPADRRQTVLKELQERFQVPA